MFAELEIKNYKFYVLAKRSYLSLYILRASHLWGTYEWYRWFDFYRWEICVSEMLHSLQATKPRIKSKFMWFQVLYTFHCILQNQKFQAACKMCSAEYRLYNVCLRVQWWSWVASGTVLSQCSRSRFPRSMFDGKICWWVSWWTLGSFIFLESGGKSLMDKKEIKRFPLKMKKNQKFITFVFKFLFAKKLMGKYIKHYNMKQ